MLSQRRLSSAASMPRMFSTARTSACHGSTYTHTPVGRSLSLLIAAVIESSALSTAMMPRVQSPEGVRLKLCSESPTPPRRSRMGATSSVMARTASSVVRGRGFSR
nr:hypothetical protein [Suid alphaherpesvirus 1]